MIEDKHASTGRMPSDIDGDEHLIRCSDCGRLWDSGRVVMEYGKPVCDECSQYRRKRVPQW